MNDFLLLATLFVVLTIIAGLLRAVRGPTRVDRLTAVQLFGSGGVAILMLLADAGDAPGLRVVALVFALLSAVMTVAFVKRAWIAGPVHREQER